MDKTIHEIAKQYIKYWPLKSKIKDSCPQWLREKILRTSRRAHLRRVARNAITEHDRLNTCTLDFRGWHRDGRIEGPGSGRAADWLDIGFRHLAVTAETVYRLCGYRGAECRTIARTLHRLPSGSWEQRPAKVAQLNTLPPCLIEPRFFDRGYDEHFARNMAGALHRYNDGLAGEHAQRWLLFLEWEVRRATAESDRQKRLADIATDPNYRISGYLASSILQWRGVPGQHDYSGCSGCSSYAIHREHPEEWSLLLSRAPHGTASAHMEQVYPHEIERAKELRAQGWQETLRLSDSIFTAPAKEG